MNLYSWSLKRSLAVMLPLFLLNWIGVTYSLYGVLWWWDVMTHFMGGIFIGFLLLALGARFKLVTKHNWQYLWTVGLLGIFVGWELYEVIINLVIPTYKMDYIDTVHDVVNDLLGGAAAYYWYRYFNQNTQSLSKK